MKKIILCTVLLIIVNASFSQQTTPSPILTKQDYLKKSKQQKRAAWILLGAGIFGTVVGTVKFNFAGSYEAGGYEEEDNPNSASAIFLVAGLAAIGTSIPFFIASSKNKKKAMSLSFKNESAPQMLNSSIVYKPVPSLSLNIRL